MGGEGEHDSSLVVPTAAPAATADLPTPSYRIASGVPNATIVSGDAAPYGSYQPTSLYEEQSAPLRSGYASNGASYAVVGEHAGPCRPASVPHVDDRRVYANEYCTVCGMGLQHGFRFCPGCGAPIGTAPSIFDMIDTNHDGMITRAEFNRALSPLRLGRANLSYEPPLRRAPVIHRERAGGPPHIQHGLPEYVPRDTMGVGLGGFTQQWVGGPGYARELYRYDYPLGVGRSFDAPRPIVLTTPGYAI